MASSNTFSPDSIHGGPVIATLCGKFKKMVVDKKTRNTTLVDDSIDHIDRGDIFFVIKVVGKPYYNFIKEYDSSAKNFFPNMAIAAEAVALNHGQRKHQDLVHIPVVVYGRTQVNLSCVDTTTFNGGDFACIGPDKRLGRVNQFQKFYPSVFFNVTFLHPVEKVKKSELPFEVFVEQKL